MTDTPQVCPHSAGRTAESPPLSYPFDAPGLALHPLYAELRATTPTVRVQLPYGEPAWLVTRYEDVKFVLGDSRFSRAAARDHDEPRSYPGRRDLGMTSLDPPEQSRLRRPVTKAFNHRRVESLRPRIQEITDSLIEEMLEIGPPVDLIGQFALRLTVPVICELLGVPVADRDRFQKWSEIFVSSTRLSPEVFEEYSDSLNGYIAELIAERRREPTGDLLSSLVSVRDVDDLLIESELVQISASMLAAGHESTATQIANYTYTLLRHPEELRRLRQDPGLIPKAVEELLRHSGRAEEAVLARYALEDVEVGGVLIRAGEPVLAANLSANHDETVFTDPLRLDLGREPNPHVTFGHGPHHCIGSQLARAELQIAIGTLITRLPGLRLAVEDHELVWKEGQLIRGLETLPVTW